MQINAFWGSGVTKKNRKSTLVVFEYLLDSRICNLLDNNLKGTKDLSNFFSSRGFAENFGIGSLRKGLQRHTCTYTHTQTNTHTHTHGYDSDNFFPKELTLGGKYVFGPALCTGPKISHPECVSVKVGGGSCIEEDRRNEKPKQVYFLGS